MAKPLSEKSVLIRELITNNPGLGNKEIAELLNGHEDRKKDKIEVKPGDVAQQKQAMKKGSEAAPTAGKKESRPPTTEAAAVVQRPTQASPVDLIDKALDLAQQCGGVGELKKLVDRLADMRAW